VSIYVYAGDPAGCGHFRMIWPAQALIRQGYDVKLMMPDNRGIFQAHKDDDGRPHRVDLPPDAEAIVMQRVTHTVLAASIPVIRAQGVAVIVDQDDDLSHIHPANEAFKSMHPRKAALTGHSWEAAAQACRAATLVTTSTPALAEAYGRPGTARVLHNCLPGEYFAIPRRDSALVGYAGSLHSHPDDVPQLGDSIRRLVDDGHRFRVVSDGKGFREVLGLDGEVDATGAVPIGQWPARVAELGIGVAPLAESRFNAGKSWLKPLEYSALGIPWVASPRAEYAALHERTGVGFLARRPRDWHRYLTRLIGDDGLRREQSEAGRAAVADMTYDRHAWRWWEAWTDAIALERGHRAA
jgi:hypothetical protein